jgi:hypothetical protein
VYNHPNRILRLRDAALGLGTAIAIIDMVFIVFVFIVAVLTEPIFLLPILAPLVLGLWLSGRVPLGPGRSLLLLVVSTVLAVGGFALTPTGDPYFTIGLIALMTGLLIYGVVVRRLSSISAARP